jgi:hypothetical protein
VTLCVRCGHLTPQKWYGREFIAQHFGRVVSVAPRIHHQLSFGTLAGLESPPYLVERKLPHNSPDIPVREPHPPVGHRHTPRPTDPYGYEMPSSVTLCVRCEHLTPQRFIPRFSVNREP